MCTLTREYLSDILRNTLAELSEVEVCVTYSNGVYVCPDLTCGFTSVRESVVNGHVVVAHKLGQDLGHGSGSEVEFNGFGEGTGRRTMNILIL